MALSAFSELQVQIKKGNARLLNNFALWHCWQVPLPNRQTYGPSNAINLYILYRNVIKFQIKIKFTKFY